MFSGHSTTLNISIAKKKRAQTCCAFLKKKKKKEKCCHNAIHLRLHHIPITITIKVYRRKRKTFVLPEFNVMVCLCVSVDQEIVDWFNSIRAVQLHYLKVAFPGASELEVSKHMISTPTCLCSLVTRSSRLVLLSNCCKCFTDYNETKRNSVCVVINVRNKKAWTR